MINFTKYGFIEDKTEGLFYKDNLIIYKGLGMDVHGGFSVELFTLCVKEDVGILDKIIIRGNVVEVENYLKEIYRKEKINELLNGEIYKKQNNIK